MVEYVAKYSDLLFDPASGKGAFYVALRRSGFFRNKVRFYGIDIDKRIIREAKDEGLYENNVSTLEIRDFIFNPPQNKFSAIVANPPYVRHHRLSIKTKNELKKISQKIMDSKVDGRAGLHVFFLIQALNLLKTEGKLAFIMLADTCEGIFASKLWNWITSKYHLECVITFSPEATPFPNVDTNAIVFLIRNQMPKQELYWVVVKKSGTYDLKKFVKSNFKKLNFPNLEIKNRKLDEALKTGLSRPPVLNNIFKYRLKDFAKIMRGIATGGNDFFYLTKKQAQEINIPQELLKPAIGRTRDVKEPHIDKKTLDEMDKNNRPTLLFSPDGRPLEEFPKEVQEYLLYGEKLGLNNRALIKQRSPWYKMERREVPEFLFAYLGRRNTRFLKNNAGVLPLTGFLCVYSLSKDKYYIEKLWEILQNLETIKNLRLVGKSYGGGAIKVEPRALDNLPLPTELVEKLNLRPQNQNPSQGN